MYVIRHKQNHQLYLRREGPSDFPLLFHTAKDAEEVTLDAAQVPEDWSVEKVRLVFMSEPQKG